MILIMRESKQRTIKKEIKIKYYKSKEKGITLADKE